MTRNGRIAVFTVATIGVAAVVALMVSKKKALAAAPPAPEPLPLPPPPPTPSSFSASVPTPTSTSTTAPKPSFDPFDKLGPFKTAITQDEIDWLRSLGQ